MSKRNPRLNYREVAEKIIVHKYGKDYMHALKDFENLISLIENNIYKSREDREQSLRDRGQSLRNIRGHLYEYLVFKALSQLINSDDELKNKFYIIRGSEGDRSKVGIRNWSIVYPDVDILLIERSSKNVKAIISCKTSLRERLTETAFWKRELERHESTRNVKVIFITPDESSELKNDTNRYIALHVLDYTFITDEEKYVELIETLRRRYGEDKIMEFKNKVKFIDEIGEILKTL